MGVFAGARAAVLVVLVTGCAVDSAVDHPGDDANGKQDDPTSPDAGAPAIDAGAPANSYNVSVEVLPTGPYGSKTFALPAGTNWVNTGLYLRSGDTAHVTGSGTWTFDGFSRTAEGGPTTVGPGACREGMLAGRVGLHYDENRSCIGEDGDFTATHDGIFYVAMNVSTDLGETYESRRRAEGSIEVTVESDGDTVPAIFVDDLASYDLGAVSSGWIEILGEHVLVSIATADAQADLATAVAGVDTLDAIYEQHQELRGAVPHRGQRIRFFPDHVMSEKGWYMLAGNPVRCDPGLMSGAPSQRILRAAEPATDIWGFAHELGHDFTMIGGTWTYMVENLESWPNLFTLHALEALGRTANQPNASTYCTDKGSYLASPTYQRFKTDPFVQLCFLQDFTKAHGWEFWQRFFIQLNATSNSDIPNAQGDALARPLWGWIRDRFTEAADSDTTAVFNQWSVPLP